MNCAVAAPDGLVGELQRGLHFVAVQEHFALPLAFQFFADGGALARRIDLRGPVFSRRKAAVFPDCRKSPVNAPSAVRRPLNFGSPNAPLSVNEISVALHRDAGERRALHTVARDDGGAGPLLAVLRQVDDDVEFVARNLDRSVPAGFERFRRTGERAAARTMAISMRIGDQCG